MKKHGYQIGFIFFLFGSTFFFHFLYDWLPSPFTLLFAPVNESIFEHMKLISSAWLWIYVKFLDTIFCRNLSYLNLFQFLYL